MNKCLHCTKSTKTKFCNKSCAASYNNAVYPKRVAGKAICLGCDEEISTRSGRKYCSNKCQMAARTKAVIDEWLLNGVSLPRSAKGYILAAQDNKCILCALPNVWQEKELVFILDHIDGNSDNNKRENLRLICPNCDSQLDTYKSRNKGNGRHSRRQRYAEGKSF